MKSSGELVDPTLGNLLKRIFRGEKTAWPEGWGPVEESRFLETTAAHGIQSLLHFLLHESGSPETWPRNVRERFQHETRLQTLFEVRFQAELRAVLSRLDQAGVRPVLLKGTPLAYTHYPQPHLRPRCDCDFLIPQADVEKVEAVAVPLGYSRLIETRGDLIRHQTVFVRESSPGVRFGLDVHWKISNRRFFSERLNYGELSESAVPVPELGPTARAADSTQALLFACVHRVGHHADEERLIWLYDLHLLAQRMTPAEFETMLETADRKDILTAVHDGLKKAEEWFNTKFPVPLPEVERRYSIRIGKDRSARYVMGNREGFRDWLLELGEFRGLDKLRFLGQHLFPSAEYMMARYETRNGRLLPWLYVRRLISGMSRQFSIKN